MAIVLLSTPAHATPTVEEVQAAYLYQFGRFASWPDSAKGPTPVRIGVFASNEFRSTVERVVRGRTVQGRPVVVQQLSSAEDARACQIVYISGQGDKWTSETLARLRDASVLTVGDGDRFLRMGGMIGFQLRAQRVRFDVELHPVAAAGIRLHSQLLSIAGSVRGARTEGR